MPKQNENWDFINNHKCIIRNNQLVVMWVEKKGKANINRSLSLNLSYLLKLVARNAYYLNKKING